MDHSLTKDILDSIGEGLFTVNKDFKINYFNSAAEKMTGYSKDEALGRFCKHLFKKSRPLNLAQKKAALISNISTLKSVLIAYSGGVDSTLLLKISHDVLKDRVVAVTVASALQPGHEKNAAMQQAKSMGVQHIIIAGRAMDNTEFVKNDKDRCYHCKKFLFHDLLSLADELGLAHVAHGANTDDLNDYRPGYRAANELGIVAPLLDA